ncbi:hypothetical protein EB796_000170 [Bugula neritina]|uniref:Uncharacterized protein n=1 Tax=Bugula neritina TaxID=10212 RepID=A0A7J7KTV4_BUGNE|nr:hypothetical protein EB796_000170 [Bugula neritina]
MERNNRVPNHKKDKSSVVCPSGVVLLVTASLLLAVVAIVTACILTFNLRESQQKDAKNIEVLEVKVQKLEDLLANGCCSNKEEDLEPMHGGMSLRERFRSKRNANLLQSSLLQSIKLEESDHIRNEHHGLASSHIALLYGDPQHITEISNAQQVRECFYIFHQAMVFFVNRIKNIYN